MANPIDPRPHWNRVLIYLKAHKIISGILLIVVLGGGYYVYAKFTAPAAITRYVLSQVESRTIISSLSETGQVAASDQIDVKAKVSAQITRVLVKSGDKVYAGQPIAYLDSTSAQNQISQAQASLATSKLQYQKDSAQAPISFENAKNILALDTQTLQDEYATTYNTLSSVYLNLPTVMTGVQNALYGYDLSASRSQWNSDVMVNFFNATEDRAQAQKFVDSARNDYQTARTQFDAALTLYKTITRTSSPAELETLLAKSTDMSIAVAQAVQSELNLLNTISDLQQKNNILPTNAFTALQTAARSYITTANSAESSLIAEKKTLTSCKQSITTDQQNLTLLQVGDPTHQGSNPISLQVTAANIAASEQNLATLKSNLADYVVRSPFDGIVSDVTANVGDSGGTIATIITKTQLAQLSVNEVDAAKISVGQKATLSFDALEDFALVGKVASINPVGSVNQGVVTYTVDIAFVTTDPRVKPGMTVNASIITASKADVLAVPSSAIKNSATNGSYVLVATGVPTDGSAVTGAVLTTPPVQTTVTTGITDDSYIEILSGLAADQYVVTKTTTASATTQQTGSILSALGVRAPGAGGPTGTRTNTTGGAASPRAGN